MGDVRQVRRKQRLPEGKRTKRRNKEEDMLGPLKKQASMRPLEQLHASRIQV